MKKSLDFFRQRGDSINSDDAKVVKDFYESQIEPELRKSESSIVKQLEEFKLRLAKVQSNQRHIEEEFNMKASITSPYRSKKDFSTARKTEDPRQTTPAYQPHVQPFEQGYSQEKGLPLEC